MLWTSGAERSSVGVKGTDQHGNGSLTLQRSSYLYPVSFIPGRANASPSNTQGGSPVRESRPPGSVRGAPSNGCPYRDRTAPRPVDQNGNNHRLGDPAQARGLSPPERTVTLCPAATASQTEVSDIWPVPPTNRTLSATDLLLQISFIGIETDTDQHPVQDRVEHRQCCGICSKLIFAVRWCDALGLELTSVRPFHVAAYAYNNGRSKTPLINFSQQTWLICEFRALWTPLHTSRFCSRSF